MKDIAAIAIACLAACGGGVHAMPLTATVQLPPAAETGYFKLGTTRNPAGHEISVNSRSLLLDGFPWFAVMGEMHYSRVPESEWRAELLKMKAGGIDIVATYVFWIHHEEIEGQWDWSGRRDLGNFLQICNDVGLKAVVRCGPWCHGEARNGGLPDWVAAHKDWKTRSTDTNFLAATGILYGQIASQLRGKLWKDGGPVIGIQVDNEFGGAPEYLMALKKMAIEAGMDVPLYIKTGWPAMRAPVPLGELLPLFGAYADGFWDRSIQPMSGNSWENFIFKHTRTDTGVGNDTLGNRKSGDTAGTEKYPYLTCEIGGGMPASYHRRMNYDARDVEAVALCQLGSGSSLMGYYMYHGGQNPEGKLTTLQESQATGYPNDLPVKNYDFNAPIGEYGQINPQYYWFRRLHLFLHGPGKELASMPLTLPDLVSTNKNDLESLRWAARSDGHQGFVFANNYRRLQPMPAKQEVQFCVNLPDDGPLVFPRKPVTIPADVFFIWPFNEYLSGLELVYATAQPICKVEKGENQVYYFAETPGVKAEFIFHPGGAKSQKSEFYNVKPGRKPAISLKNRLGERIQIVLLSQADSLAVRLDGGGQVVFDKSRKETTQKITVHEIRREGEARKIPLSTGRSHIAIAPADSDFTNAAVWRISLPKETDSHALLRIRYMGDVARLTLDGKLIDDDFYSGRPFEIGLGRYGADVFSGELRLQILPLRRDAPIYFEPGWKPEFGAKNTLLELQSVEIVHQNEN